MSTNVNEKLASQTAIETLISAASNAVKSKLNSSDASIDNSSVTIKSNKIQFNTISAMDVQAAWNNLNIPEYLKGVTGENFNPSTGAPIVLYNSSTSKKEVILAADYNAADYPTATYIPIGVVVIPKSHTAVIYPEGDPAKGKDIMMSLKSMRYDNPDNGGTDQGIRWGGHGTDISELFNYTKAPVISNSVSIEDPTSPDKYSFIPSDKFSALESVACPGTFYQSASESKKCPSPYLYEDGKYKPNPAYYLSWSGSDPSVTSDFKGRQNTEIICSKITVADWMTISAIPNSYDAGNHPAAACCARYRTVGTDAGDWYLPAGGEVGYIIPFFNKINSSLSIINTVAGPDIAYTLNSSSYYWSSSEYSSITAYYVDTGYGSLRNHGKYDSLYVRAFAVV